jgi:hypothetical protein
VSEFDKIKPFLRIICEEANVKEIQLEDEGISLHYVYDTDTLVKI